MDEIHTERRRQKPCAGHAEEQSPAPEQYWDLRDNRGNIFIIPSGDATELLTKAIHAATSPPPK